MYIVQYMVYNAQYIFNRNTVNIIQMLGERNIQPTGKIHLHSFEHTL